MTEAAKRKYIQELRSAWTRIKRLMDSLAGEGENREAGELALALGWIKAVEVRIEAKPPS